MQTPTGTQETALTREMPPVNMAETSPLPPAPTLISASGDACASCGAMVAPDQRYCIECGERRGEPRLPFMDGRTAAEPPAEVVAQPVGYPQQPPPPHKSKWSSGLALLATIGLLLLAMGVGVLIGNNGDQKAVAQAPVVIGGAATAATGASAATGADTSAAASKGADSNGDTSAGVSADAVAKKNGVKLAPKNVDLGGKCPKGSVGCDTSGKFTGDYFK
jgi:hypothetical protein